MAAFLVIYADIIADPLNHISRLIASRSLNACVIDWQDDCRSSCRSIVPGGENSITSGLHLEVGGTEPFRATNLRRVTAWQAIASLHNHGRCPPTVGSRAEEPQNLEGSLSSNTKA